MSIVKTNIGSIEDLMKGDVIPSMFIISSSQLEKINDNIYRDTISGVTFFINDGRFLVTEVNGFTYASLLCSFLDEGAEKFDENIYKINDKLGFILSGISKDRINEGLIVEFNDKKFDAVEWLVQYDGDSYLSGIKCVKDGKKGIVPINYSGNYQFLTPSCSIILQDELSKKRTIK